MNIAQIEQFNKREQVIRLIKDDIERNKQLELLQTEKDEAYKDCWIKTTQRIKNSELMLNQLQVSVKGLENSIKELTLTVKSKASIYDEHVKEANEQSLKIKGMKQLISILKWLFAAGLGGFAVKLIQQWPF